MENKSNFELDGLESQLEMSLSVVELEERFEMAAAAGGRCSNNTVIII